MTGNVAPALLVLTDLELLSLGKHVLRFWHKCNEIDFNLQSFSLSYIGAKKYRHAIYQRYSILVKLHHKWCYVELHS